MLCEDGLLYHGEAETISAVAAPTKGSASRRVGKIEAQSQRMLQLKREMLAQLSHAWKTFHCQSSDRLFSWSGGQLDCRRSPARAWKPEGNQGGFASASSTLEYTRPMIAEAGYVCVGISHHVSSSAHSHTPAQAVGPG
ncbi:hypothetical protein O181_117401 [Austropuccinia psidii MF-1]|uniref:Uncharacterized protein n=1 Tax=Austropuccinia psidii MF-1 TaxID=1389203 RepID=A0A9Q3PXW8_9BASI|nr:hypothetical protein [Austropuccinia psidii MF-1]